jgi:carbon storage regulator
MLVLTRKKNESIIIDGGIVIEVLQISRDQIRIGVTAPAEVKVLRSELRPFSQQQPVLAGGAGALGDGAGSLADSAPLANFVASINAANGNRLHCVREPDAVFQTSSQQPCHLKIAFAS